MNDGYSYDSKIEQLFLEIHCQNEQKKWCKVLGKKKLQSNAEHLLICSYENKSVTYIQLKGLWNEN